MRSRVSYRLLLLVGILSVSIFSLNTFVVLPAVSVSDHPQQLLQSAFATFPGENGKIAFTTLRDGNYEIYVMNPDGSEQINISRDRSLDRDPDWSSDGGMIAFASDRPNSVGFGTKIWVMNVDGSNPRQVTSNEVTDEDPSWSPDGTKIAFSGRQDIIVVNADGTEQRTLTFPSANDQDPSWSPDGTKIAFVSDRDGNKFFEC